MALGGFGIGSRCLLKDQGAGFPLQNDTSTGTMPLFLVIVLATAQ